MPLTLTEFDAIDWALHCMHHLVAAAYCTDESEDQVVDPCVLTDILGAIERHIATIDEALKAADARRPEKGGA